MADNSVEIIQEFDDEMTPAPAILMTLAMSPITPADGICELIDNALDGFAVAAIVDGLVVENPLIEVHIPKKSDLTKPDSYFEIRDNGPGLNREEANKALRAGYSGQTQFASLGMFGVGFNIATGKIGRRVSLTTAKDGDEHAVRIVYDIQEMAEQGGYNYKTTLIKKPEGLEHGTWIRIDRWWEKGHINANFIDRIAGMSHNSVLEVLGRRYGAALRENNVKLKIYDSPEKSDLVEPFEHCVWAKHRSLQATGTLDNMEVPARIEIDKVLGEQYCCVECGRFIQQGHESCEIETHLSTPKKIENRIRGWVGIQRWDSREEYGIDLIRNGRTIDTFNKELFFYSPPDELGRKTLEYPVDDHFGRIVGELHLDGCQVDFMKQQFNALYAPFQEAIEYVRGKSLLPGQWEEGYVNKSPISQLHNAYKKVRINRSKSALENLYPGEWDPVNDKPKRVSREWEEDAKKRFRNREDGWFDDEMWFHKVEFGGLKPDNGNVVSCPECAAENDQYAAQCEFCEHIFNPLICTFCDYSNLRTNQNCTGCGEPLAGSAAPIITTETVWACSYCEYQNEPDLVACGQCNYPRGEPHPMDPKVLRDSSTIYENLCIENLSIALTPDTSSNDINLKAYATTTALKPHWDSASSIPLVRHSEGLTNLSIYFDPKHEVFNSLETPLHVLISGEVANFIFELYSQLKDQPGYSQSTLNARILEKYFSPNSEQSGSDLNEEVPLMFAEICERLFSSDEAIEFYDNLPPESQEQVGANLHMAGKLVNSGIRDLVDSGTYLEYLPKTLLTDFFNQYSDLWFKNVWVNADLAQPSIVGEVKAKELTNSLKGTIFRALGDCAAFADTAMEYHNQHMISRAKTGLKILLDVI